MKKRSVYVSVVVAMITTMSACGDKDESNTAPAPVMPAGTSTQGNGAGNEAGTGTNTADRSVVPVKSNQQVFWEALQTLCGHRYSGQLTVGTEESDREFGYANLTIDAKRCEKDAIDIGLAVDEDDSRTWMIRRTPAGLSLHHRHLGEDGHEDETSGYGGNTSDSGTSQRQEFPADTNTGEMIPAAATNIWAIEVTPNKTFAYELRRDEDQRRFRIVFDISQALGNL